MPLRGGYDNVEFRLGDIENLPVGDASVDRVISNCVLNLVPDKKRAFAEAYRVLKPGGRLHLSDIVLTRELPEPLRESVAALVGCIAGAAVRAEYLATISQAGFTDITVESEHDALDLLSGCSSSDPLAGEIAEACCSEGIELPEGLAVSITLSARKGLRNPCARPN